MLWRCHPLGLDRFGNFLVSNFTLSIFADVKKLFVCFRGVVKMFQMLAAVSLSFIFISITSFCLKTHPAMRVSTVSVHQTSFGHRHNISGVDLTETALSVSKRRDEAHPAFFYVDSVCNAWFAVEVIIRLMTSPRPWKLLRSPHNLIDMTATLSFYLDSILTRLQVDRSRIACTATALFSLWLLSSYFVYISQHIPLINL